MSPEEAAALRDRTLAESKQFLAELEERRAGVVRVEPTPAAPEPPKSVQHEEQPMHSNGYWDRHQDFIEKVIDQRLGVAARAWTIKHVEDVTVALAGEAGNLMAGLRRELRGEFKTAVETVRSELQAEFDRRLVEAELRTKIAFLEQRLVAEAEQRAAAGRPQDAAPSRPKLIGSADAA